MNEEVECWAEANSRALPDSPLSDHLQWTPFYNHSSAITIELVCKHCETEQDPDDLQPCCVTFELAMELADLRGER